MRTMKVLVLTLIFVLGCAGSNFSIRDFLGGADVTERVVRRIVDLTKDPVFDPEDCKSDAKLLDEFAQYIADQIDSGEASQSAEWALVTWLSEMISDLGCDFDPEDWE